MVAKELNQQIRTTWIKTPANTITRNHDWLPGLPITENTQKKINFSIVLKIADNNVFHNSSNIKGKKESLIQFHSFRGH